MNVKLAWRNLWRNNRRTLITLASVLFAIFLAVFASSMQQGTWDHMIRSVVNNYTGLIQIHQQGYWENPVIDNAFPLPDIEKIIQENSDVNSLAPRLESFALVSTENKTTGALVVGVDPYYESQVSELSEKLIEGNYLNADDKAVMIAAGLAEKMKLNINDTIVLLGQGYRGNSAVGKYPVKGIVKFGSVDLNDRMIYLPLAESQWFYAAPDLVTALVVKPENPDRIDRTKNSIKEQLSDEYEVMDWMELLPELVQAMQVDTGGLVIMFVVIYMVIGFGIFSTIVMMMAERQHEFGVLLAIGLKKIRLITVVVLELIFLSIIGIVAGLILVTPFIAWFYNHPIMLSGSFAEVYNAYGFEPMFVFSAKPTVFLNQALTIFIITVVITLYPIIKLFYTRAVDAMRS